MIPPPGGGRLTPQPQPSRRQASSQKSALVPVDPHVQIGYNGRTFTAQADTMKQALIATFVLIVPGSFVIVGIAWAVREIRKARQAD